MFPVCRGSYLTLHEEQMSVKTSQNLELCTFCFLSTFVLSQEERDWVWFDIACSFTLTPFEEVKLTRSAKGSSPSPPACGCLAYACFYLSCLCMYQGFSTQAPGTYQLGPFFIVDSVLSITGAQLHPWPLLTKCLRYHHHVPPTPTPRQPEMPADIARCPLGVKITANIYP